MIIKAHIPRRGCIDLTNTDVEKMFDEAVAANLIEASSSAAKSIDQMLSALERAGFIFRRLS